MGKQITYTENDKAIVALLKEHEEGMTLAEISEALGREIKPGSLTGAVRKELVEVVGSRDILREGKRQVTVYNFVTGEVLNKADGKPNTYTDGEQKILATAATMEGNFTLAELATAMGVEKIASGSINSLVKKGNIGKLDEKATVACQVKSTVNVYGFANDIPNA